MNIDISWPKADEVEAFSSKHDEGSGKVLYTVKTRTSGKYTIESELFETATFDIIHGFPCVKTSTVTVSDV